MLSVILEIVRSKANIIIIILEMLVTKGVGEGTNQMAGRDKGTAVTLSHHSGMVTVISIFFQST